MQLTGLQITALLRMGLTMAFADGEFQEEEKVILCIELMKFGVQPDAAKNFMETAVTMDNDVAVGILKNMTTEQKKYATAYLAIIMAADGKIHPDEMKVWQVVSTICNFPTMRLNEALNFWKTH